MKNMQLSQPAPITQIVPVADLYELKIEGGPMTRHTKSSYVASEWIKAGPAYTVQEYVKLERLQEAYTAPPAPAPAVPTTVNFSENSDADMCRTWAWERVKEMVTTDGWDAGDSANFFAFFCWGWDMRRQYNEQRPPDPAVGIPDKVSCEGFDPKDWVEARNLGQCEGWNAYRAAMLEPVSQRYKLNSPETPDGWIACEDRMPVPNTYVQVSNGVWVGIGMYNDADHFEDDERWQDEHNEFIDLLHHPVTHWMPLPALPIQGKKQ